MEVVTAAGAEEDGREAVEADGLAVEEEADGPGEAEEAAGLEGVEEEAVGDAPQ